MKTNKLTKALGKIKLGAMKHSPEILVVSGIVGLIGAGVLACRATTKVQNILDDRCRQLTNVAELRYAAENSPENNKEDYTEEDARKDRLIINVQTGLKIAGLYAPAVGVAATSVISILAGHNILRRRSAAIAAAYAAVDNGFKEYRKRVVQRFGEKVDEELKLGVKTKQITETKIDEDSGKEKKVKSVVDVADGILGSSPYSFIFDKQTAPSVYESDSDYMMMRLRQEQAYANDLLNARGYLTLNEVLERLGIRTSKMGQIVGWAKSGGDGFVDFGVREMKVADIDGDEDKIILDFNCQGNILDLI